jgi:hypothetical protein
MFKCLKFKYLNNHSLTINLNKITEIFCFVDEFTIKFNDTTQHFMLGNAPKRTPTMSDSEVISIIILFHLSGFRCFKHFYMFYVQVGSKNCLASNLFSLLLEPTLSCIWS